MARLHQQHDDEARALAETLQIARQAPSDPAEVTWIQRIEALRNTLQQNTDAVSFRDYGVPTRLHGGRSNGQERHVTRTVAQVCRASTPLHEVRVLFHLIRHYGPTRCLELGTCLGLSAAYQAAALTLNNTWGHLITLEGGEALAVLARTHLHQLGLNNVTVVDGPFADTLPTVLTNHGPFDYVFIDGHHDPAAMQTYFRQIAPYLAEGALLVFDDIVWTSGMRKAWNVITADPRIRPSADLLAFGIGFFHRELLH